MKTLILTSIAFMLVSTHAFAKNRCDETQLTIEQKGLKMALAKLKKYNVKQLSFDFPGLEIGVVNDSTMSTGATLFSFEGGQAVASFDSRGGSVASSETTLLDYGSYANTIDGVVFSGGSTMGLAAGDGVRRAVFEKRANSAGSDFDFIPSIPTAVVYDYSGRVEDHHDSLIYPNDSMGYQLYKNKKPSVFPVGRVGAGVTTTVNKIAEPRWGGQGAAFAKIPGIGRIFVAVVLNPVGDIIKDGTSFPPQPSPKEDAKKGVVAGRKNTTLSIVVVDADLNPNQLKRLAATVHTSMGGAISPFHTYTDGDIMFTVSAGKRKHKVDENQEFAIGMYAAELMKAAIYSSVEVANIQP